MLTMFYQCLPIPKIFVSWNLVHYNRALGLCHILMFYITHWDRIILSSSFFLQILIQSLYFLLYFSID